MKRIIFLLSVIFAASCTSSQEMKFNKFGISFICPSGWKITDEENFDNAGYYLSCEKNGFNASGLTTISWVNDTIDLSKTIALHKDELKKNSTLKNSDLNFSEETSAEFNHYESRSMKFSFSLIGIKNNGTIYCFHRCGKTITIIKQEALEDQLENKKGFEIIENNFSCK